MSFTGVWSPVQAGAPQGSPGTAPQPLVRIDHIPLAVHDLERAVNTYRRLGFAIKPGRLHPDGIRNMHVKFTNGAGIELITAAAAKDDLTRRYLTLLAQGEGPAFVGFYTPGLAALEARLEQAGIRYRLQDNLLVFSDPALAWPFMFDVPNLARNENPRYFQHPNTASATLGVWIAGDAEALALFRTLGARVERKRVYVPDPAMAEVASLADGGEVIFLPATRQILPGRPIVGITVRTKDLDALDRELRSGGITPAATRTSGSCRSTFIAPRDAHGVWLEFRQPG